MELLLKMKLDNLYKDKDFISQDGETKVSKWKAQSLDKVATEQGEQVKLFNVSITDEFYEKVKGKIGETITIPVKTYINGKQIGFYGI